MVNGVETRYHYDENDVVAEIRDGAMETQYINSLNIDERFIRQGENTEYYHVDVNGSTLALTDSSGAMGTRYNYDPFGNTTTSSTSLNAFQYTGRENDGTGLYYYRARYYDPILHRFLSEDPILTPYTPLYFGLCTTNETIWPLPIRLTQPQPMFGQSFNAYPYVLNNPLLNTDPLGLEGKKKDKCTAAAIQDCFIDLSVDQEFKNGIEAGRCLLNETAANNSYCQQDSTRGGVGCYTAADFSTNLSNCLNNNNVPQNKVPKSCDPAKTGQDCGA